MATIILSLSTKSDKVTSQHEVLIRFFHGKHVNQRTKTNVFVHPDHWSDATQSIIIPKWRTLSKERKQLKDELQQKSERLAAITSLVQSSFQEIDKGNVPNDWLKKLIHEQPSQSPSRRNRSSTGLSCSSRPKTIRTAAPSHSGWWNGHWDATRATSANATKTSHSISTPYPRRLSLTSSITSDGSTSLLRRTQSYLSEITQKHKSPKITERGDNHIVNLQKKLKRFFLWLNKEGYSTNRPFDGVEIKAEKYGTPIILTLEERNKIADFDLSSKPDNVVNGQIEYIPRKTKDNKPVTAEVPLNDRATAILEKYRNVDLSPYKSKVNSNPLLPFISSQKYNEAIKEVFKICGIDRMVTVLDPVSGEQTQKPFYEIASSHLARRTFVGLLYNQIQDPNLISSMSGHVEGSREFARYRKIEREAKKKAVDLIN